ncbi:hypothetical protein BGW39_003169, partial [Mortierella sp. 14UC]
MPVLADQPPIDNPPPPLDHVPANGGFTPFDAMPFLDISLDALLRGDIFFNQNIADEGHAQAAGTEINDHQGQEITTYIEEPVVSFFVDQLTGDLYVENCQERLGQGTYGCVHEVTNVHGVKLALKMPTKHTRADMIAQEIKFLNRLNDRQGHENVVTFHGTVNDISGTGLLFDLCHPRDFWELLTNRGALLEEECRYYGKQLINGLSFIHQRGVLHCDLKPNNILVAMGMVLKICDFGMAEDIEEQDKKPYGSRTSTPGFVAPEIVKFAKHTPALDVFSIGCVFYRMIAGKLFNLTTRDVAKPLPDGFWKDFDATSNAKDVLRRMLDYDPMTRITLESLRGFAFFHQGYCPTSLPESAFDEPPTFTESDKRQSEGASTREDEGREVKKIRREEKGKAVIRGCVEPKVEAAA